MSVAIPDAGLVGPAAVEARLAASPAWLAELRARAWELYQRLPMPAHMRDEDWRRTDLGSLDPAEHVADPAETGHGDALIEHLAALRDRIDPDAAFVVSTRRGVRRCEVPDRLTAQGVIVSSLEDAAVNHPDLVARALETVAPVGDTTEHGDAKFLALWHALWRGGVFVHVPAGVEAHVPVVAAHGAGGDRPAVFPATVALLDAHASLTLIEIHASPAGGAPLLSDAVSALVIGEAAQLDHCVLQQWGGGATHVALHRASLAREAVLRSFYATLGARLQKTYIEAMLEGAGADARIAGVCFGGGSQHLDHQSLQAHVAGRTVSDLLLKVAVRDQARSVYGGLVLVEEAAQQSNGYVQNRNLMLSSGARATGIPRLEIRANDVRCSHGVTAGHIDAEQRFYLESRGVAREEADRLIVRGFMQDALDRCPNPGFGAAIGNLLDETVAGESHVGLEVAAEGTTA